MQIQTVSAAQVWLVTLHLILVLSLPSSQPSGLQLYCQDGGRATADKRLQAGLLCKTPVTHQATLPQGWAWFLAAVCKRWNPGHRHLSACFYVVGSSF